MEKQLGILSFTEINELIDRGVIEGASRLNVNASSLNVTLATKFLLEKRDNNTVSGLHYNALEFSKRQSPAFTEVEGGVYLTPGAFCLASIVEKVNLPADIACHVLLRSSAARMGLEHSLAGFVEGTFSGHLTLELHNVLKYHTIHIRSGDSVCQLVFQRTHAIPNGQHYKGKYSNFNCPVSVLPEYEQT